MEKRLGCKGVFAKVVGRFSQTDAKVTKLAKEVVKQSKVAKETSDTLRSLMISIENLGDNLIKIRNELKSW